MFIILEGYLSGARYRNSTDHRLHAISMMGGAEMYIDGAGMHEIPSSNQIKFTFEHNEFEVIGENYTAPTISGKYTHFSIFTHNSLIKF